MYDSMYKLIIKCLLVSEYLQLKLIAIALIVPNKCKFDLYKSCNFLNFTHSLKIIILRLVRMSLTMIFFVPVSENWMSSTSDIKT